MLINENGCEDERNLALLERLDAGMECRLVLVVAPAGAGKTALLRRWAAERQWPVAWVALQPVDNRPQQFLQHIIAALRAVGLRWSGAWGDSLVAANLIDTFCDLVNDIIEIREEFALILDSYQVIDTPSIHEGVRFLLDYGPPQMHLVIAGRTEPPLQLARLRVRRQLVEIGPQDLYRPDSPGDSP